MPITIPEDDEAKQPKCPECGAALVRRSVINDQREHSVGVEALVCPTGHYRES